MADGHPTEDPALSAAARHALHDEELIAAFAAGDEDVDVERAKVLTGRCSTCAELATDIEAITGAVRALESAERAATHAKAPRDFRLRWEDVGLAAPGILGRIGSALGGVAAIARPVGATLATFGLVGLLLGTVSLGPIGGSPAAAPGAAYATLAPDLAGGGNAPAATDGRTQIQLGPTDTAGQESAPRTTADDGEPGPSTTALLFGGSIACLVLGVALLLAGGRIRSRGDSAVRT